MYRSRKISITILSLMLVLTMVMPAYAASGNKTVYVLTKVKIVNVGGTTENYKVSYNKKGLLKSVKWTQSDKDSCKSSYTYNKKGQATKQKYTDYKHGVKKDSGIIKYAYNKAGYLKSTKAFYTIKKKKKRINVLEYANYYSWDSNGNMTKRNYYDLEEEDNDSVEWYNYDSAGRYISGGSQEESEDYGNLNYKEECTYPQSDKCIITKYRQNPDTSAWEIYNISESYFQNGNVVQEIEYTNYPTDIDTKTIYSYKKIKVSSKNYKKVVKQQRYINELI